MEKSKLSQPSQTPQPWQSCVVTMKINIDMTGTETPPILIDQSLRWEKLIEKTTYLLSS